MNSNKKQTPVAYHCYTGILHIHSIFSDGTRPIPEIAQIANELGDVHFLLITDHNTLRGKKEGFEGWYGNVLVGIGTEINDKDDRNHYLAFNIDKEFGPAYSAETYVREVDELGGLGFIAHPDESRSHIKQYPPYPWTLWNSDRFHGIEIWNQMSEWMEGLTHINKFWRILHPRRSIVRPKPETLQRWDMLNLTRKVVGVGGVDAHGFLHRLIGGFAIRVFRYKVSFRTIRTHILSAARITPSMDHGQALQEIYASLRAGRCFISHVYLGSATEFTFRAENTLGSATMGEKLTLAADTNLSVHLPKPAAVKLIHNGKTVAQQKGQDITFPADRPGVYRVEVTSGRRPWIFSNHIRLE